jgi:hypothetical protein
MQALFDHKLAYKKCMPMMIDSFAGIPEVLCLGAGMM